MQATRRVSQKFEGSAERSRYGRDECGVFLERFARPSFRNVMSNQDVANCDLVPRAFNRPLVPR